MAESEPPTRSVVTLRDTETGETRTAHTMFSEFWWTEGNGGCDCNRAGYFHDDHEADWPCNTGPNRYVITAATYILETGE